MQSWVLIIWLTILMIHFRFCFFNNAENIEFSLLAQRFSCLKLEPLNFVLCWNESLQNAQPFKSVRFCVKHFHGWTENEIKLSVNFTNGMPNLDKTTFPHDGKKNNTKNLKQYNRKRWSRSIFFFYAKSTKSEIKLTNFHMGEFGIGIAYTYYYTVYIHILFKL